MSTHSSDTALLCPNQASKVLVSYTWNLPELTSLAKACDILFMLSLQSGLQLVHARQQTTAS